MSAPTREELERIGGEELALPYAVPKAELIGLLLLGLFLGLMAYGVLTALFSRHGLLPWASNAGWFPVIAEHVVGAGYLGLFLACLWGSWVHAVRAVAGSPALVAGPRGVRLHGAWPWPQLHAWEEIAGCSFGLGWRVQIELTPEARPPRAIRLLWRVTSGPLVLPVPKTTDLEQTVAALEALRQAALPPEESESASESESESEPASESASEPSASEPASASDPPAG